MKRRKRGNEKEMVRGIQISRDESLKRTVRKRREENGGV